MRHRYWDLLRSPSSRSALLWLIEGDFNKIWSNAETSGGLFRGHGLMDAF